MIHWRFFSGFWARLCTNSNLACFSNISERLAFEWENCWSSSLPSRHKTLHHSGRKDWLHFPFCPFFPYSIYWMEVKSVSLSKAGSGLENRQEGVELRNMSTVQNWSDQSPYEDLVLMMLLMYPNFCFSFVKWRGFYKITLTVDFSFNMICSQESSQFSQ